MDKQKFDQLVGSVREWRDRMESVGKSADEVYCTAFKNTPVEFLPVLIQRSEGDRQIWNGLRLFVQQLLRNGDPLPNAVVSWVVEVLDGKRRQPRTGKENTFRDMFLIDAVQRLEDKGFNATRSKGQNKRSLEVFKGCCAEGGSGCDIVGKALDMPWYRQVARVWDRHRTNMRAWGDPLPK